MPLHIWKFIKIFVVLICLIAAIGIICAKILHVLNQTDRAAEYSYIASVGSFVYSFSTDEVCEITNNLGEEWRLLSESEYTKLAHSMSRSDYIDRSNRSNLSYEPGEILLDHWNHHILIAGRKVRDILIVGRKVPGEKPEFIVWSKGPDGISGTDDDIIFPYGSFPPTELQERR